jgi:hypothetical protein
MITTRKQAIRVQQKRSASGKYGFARAVARFIKRTHIEDKTDLNIAFKSFPVKINWRKAEPEFKGLLLDTGEVKAEHES